MQLFAAPVAPCIHTDPNPGTLAPGVSWSFVESPRVSSIFLTKSPGDSWSLVESRGVSSDLQKSLLFVIGVFWQNRIVETLLRVALTPTVLDFPRSADVQEVRMHYIY